MTSYRYLVHFAYIGKPYRGLQIQQNCGPHLDKTVQNVLQKNLRTLLNQPSLKTYIGSRTDKGVNALSCSLHFSLPLGSTSENGKIVQPPDLEKLAKKVNIRLKLYQESIRVLKIQQVPNTFHCRFEALCRHYVYRLAIGRKDDNDIYNQAFVESAEMQWIRDSMFDTGKFIKAAEMFAGKKQFFLYKKSDRKKKFVGPTERSVIVHIRRGNSLSNAYCGGSAELWDIHIASCAFMRKQVREMVSGMIKVGQGISSLGDLTNMLNGKGTRDPTCLAGACALFLESVVYKTQALDFKDDQADQLLEKSCVFEGPPFQKHQTSNKAYTMSKQTLHVSEHEDGIRADQHTDKHRDSLYQDSIQWNNHQQTSSIYDSMFVKIFRTVMRVFKNKSQ